MAGRLSAPAGDIRLSLDKPTAGDHGFYASQALWLEAGSHLSATGQFVAERNPLGLVQGDVRPGGSITLDAKRGYLITDADSSLDVRGTSHTVQFAGENGSVPDISSRSIASTGGSILLRAGEGMVAAGQLLMQGGDSTVGGGSLVVELNGDGRGKPTESIPGGVFPDDTHPEMARAIVVESTWTTLAERLAGLHFGDALPEAAYAGQVSLPADRLNAAAPGRVTLRTDAINLQNQYVGSIRFAEDIRLQADREIVLDSPSLTWTPSSPGGIQLHAPYVALGSTRSRVDQLSGSSLLGSTLAPPAQTGPGHFSVAARGIDLVGGLSFDAFSKVDLHSQGEVRAIGIREARETRDYRGALHLAGDLNLTASRFYPATLSDYTVDLGDTGVFTLQPSTPDESPLYSAGGSLTIRAATIEQYGVLTAPFGQLQLDAGPGFAPPSGQPDFGERERPDGSPGAWLGRHDLAVSVRQQRAHQPPHQHTTGKTPEPDGPVHPPR